MAGLSKLTGEAHTMLLLHTVLEVQLGKENRLVLDVGKACTQRHNAQPEASCAFAVGSLAISKVYAGPQPRSVE